VHSHSIDDVGVVARILYVSGRWQKTAAANSVEVPAPTNPVEDPAPAVEDPAPANPVEVPHIELGSA